MVRIIPALLLILASTRGVLNAQSAGNLQTWDGESIEAEWLSLNQSVGKFNTNNGTRTVKRNELVIWSQPRNQPILSPRTAGVSLVNGDLLMGTPVDLDDTRVTWRSQIRVRDEFATIAIPLERIRSFHFSVSARECYAQSSTESSVANRDRVKLKNGDWLEGDLVELTIASLTLETEDGELKIAGEQVEQLWLNPELTLPPEEALQSQCCLFSDGSRLTLKRLAKPLRGPWNGETIGDKSFSFSESSISRILFLSERVVPLARVTPSRVKYTPFLTTLRPWRANRDLSGGPLRLGQSIFLSGFSMEPRTSLSWELSPNDRKILAIVGIPDPVDPLVNVETRIQLDGELAWARTFSRDGESQKEIALDLDGKRTISLTADFGKRGPVRDRVNWGDPLILRDAPQNEEP